MRASSSTGFIIKAIVASAWLAVLLASASLAASGDAAPCPCPRGSAFKISPLFVDAVQDGAVQSKGEEIANARRVYRTSWPEVVGMSSEEAKKKICEDWACAHMHVIPAGYGVTMEYDRGRVRVFLDSNDEVARVPRIG